MKNILMTLFVMTSSLSAYAGDCVLNITRVACPGKDQPTKDQPYGEAFSPYKGEKTTHETKKVGSLATCEKEAEKACAIVRKNVLKSKEIDATFDGKPVKDGKNVCDPKRADYNQC